MPEAKVTTFKVVSEWTQGVVDHVSVTGHVDLVPADNIELNLAGIFCRKCSQSWEIPVWILRTDPRLGIYMREQSAKQSLVSTLIHLGTQEREIKREKANTIWDRLLKDDEFLHSGVWKNHGCYKR